MRGCRGVALYIPLHPLYTPYTLSLHTPYLAVDGLEAHQEPYIPLHPLYTPHLAVDGLESHQELLQRREELGRLLGSAMRAMSAISAIRAVSAIRARSAVSAASLASQVSLVSYYLVRARSAP